MRSKHDLKESSVVFVELGRVLFFFWEGFEFQGFFFFFSSFFFFGVGDELRWMVDLLCGALRWLSEGQALERLSLFASALCRVQRTSVSSSRAAT
mmetsp:Transcript_16803/g.68724  ORF Transcript_16803/g.68724 Transcript_16803/m.68724 type:complete len:95 (-) Transcript_16803:2534-2818(-)